MHDRGGASDKFDSGIVFPTAERKRDVNAFRWRKSANLLSDLRAEKCGEVENFRRGTSVESSRNSDGKFDLFGRDPLGDLYFHAQN